MGQRSVIFGATGMVGKELVYELLENKSVDQVIVVIRHKLPIANPKLEQILENDFSSFEHFGSQLAADTFFCCIGTTIKKAGSQEAFRKVDYDIPVTISRLAESLRIPNLVIISSISASADSGNFYLRTKGQMEQQVMTNYHGNLKLIRPSIILGHRGEFRPGEMIGKWVMVFMGFLLIGHLAKYKGIYSWEIARGMVAAIHLPKEKVFIESDEMHKLAFKDRKEKQRPSGMI